MRPLRSGLALVAAIDLAVLAVVVGTTTPGTPVPAATPAALRLFVHHPLPVLIVAAAGFAGLFGFGRGGRRSVVGGVVGLVALGLLAEAHAALAGGPMRTFFTSGAMLLGWLFGETLATSSLGSSELGDSARAQVRESLAADGARGVLAATYVASGLSKLAASGASWIGPVGLRAIVLSQRPLDDSSILGAYAGAIESSASFATALAALAVVIELGAVLYPFSSRLRVVWGTLLLLFHLNAMLVLRLLRPEAMMLIALFSYRWAFTKETRLDAAETAGAPRAAVLRSLAPWILGVLVACAVLASRPVKAYTAMHRASPEDATSPGPYRDDLRALLGGLSAGDDLGGFVVQAVGTAAGGGASIDLAHGEERCMLTVTRHARLAYSPPAATDRYDVYWGRMTPSTLPEDRLRPALVALLARLRRTETSVPMPAGM